MADFIVSTRYKVDDKASSKFNKMSKSASGFESVLKGVLGAQVITSGFRLLGQGLSYVGREFVDFDAALTGAGAKFKDMSRDSAAAQKQMESLTAAARNVGATTEFSATEAAKGLEFLAMAGFGVEQSIAALPGVVDLATAANTDLATATDIASDSLGAFNLMTEDTVQLQKNLARVNDVMAKTTTTANTDLATLFEAVKKGGPAFTAAGQSLESFSAFAGVMANAGVKGSEAGTSLRNVMLRLADPTSEAAGVLKKLGVQTQDEAGNFRDIIDILSDFETGLDGMGDAQRTAALATVFGARSVTGINILLAEGTDKLRDYRKSLEDAEGASADMAETIRGSLGNRLAVLRSSLTETGFKFVEAFGDRLGKGLDNVISAVGKLNEFIDTNKEIIALRIDQVIGAASMAFRIMFNVVKFAVETFKKFHGVIIPLIAAVTAYKAAIVALTIAQQVQAGYMAITKFVQMAAAIWPIIKAAKSWTAVQWALNAAMNANPIGVIVASVAALTAGVIVLINKWKAFKSEFSDASFLDFLNPFSDERKERRALRRGETPTASIAPPNSADAAVNRELMINSRFEGTLNINGAPDGSTMTTNTEAPGFDINMMGVYP